MLLKINSVARGLLRVISKSVKKFIKSVNFTFDHSQVVLEINSVARGLLRVISKLVKKFIKSVNFAFGQLKNGPGN